MQEEQEDIGAEISFSVDSGLIDRLGRELVGKPETALSELIKNSYDADATDVVVRFIETDAPGGTLVIEDDGVGMLPLQLKNGFMRISSTDKVHNPKSTKFHRSKAGRKGIGRFATQRLGNKLTIITQTFDRPQALKLTVNWDDYAIDTEITDIKNSIEQVDKIKIEGTVLIIDGLRESWSEATITRVYRYVSELLQPDYLSDRSKRLKTATKQDASFKVSFVKIQGDQEKVIADPNTLLFEKALATIEGYVDSRHDAFCQVRSASLDVDQDVIPILHSKVYSEGEVPENQYRNLSHVHFKVYYYIFQREKYYVNITKQELANIQRLSNELGGVRLYRNGFRVLPYGEQNDDWLRIDKRYFFESGTNIPFANKNLFGFVEILDDEGKFFEETASREGLVENEAYNELIDFLYKALEAARMTLRYGVEKIKKEVQITRAAQTVGVSPDTEKTTIEKLESLEKSVNDFFNSAAQSRTEAGTFKEDTIKIVEDLKTQFQLLLDELGMLRVLAALGLTIGEFTHEVVQFSPSIMGDISVLGNQNLNSAGIRSLENLQRTIQLFTAYTSYFNATVSANVSRELKPQQLDRVIQRFKDIIASDLTKLDIEFQVDFFGYDLITTPMHASEWSSILFNLYTNSKKAIRRQGAKGEIKIIVGKEDDKKVYLEFLDNGDGIPIENRQKVFEAFFTTSVPSSFDASDEERLTGTGLGLKIIKDIVQAYGGTIEIIEPEQGYATSFRIELAMVTDKQRTEYGL
ncbi:sensor histidine kinase [Chryseolinea soli]|uniref:histidine kinase n=1 Tax=Chryseolinea soli TaxID=2321403 RepID=A0A385SL69_9BACT|nr:ATP-binding protein [Chryseolinea soli]AYB31989.1 ATP-binding protein [Chryseolinea soli]